MGSASHSVNLAVSVAGTGSRVRPGLIWNISVGLLEALVGPAMAGMRHSSTVAGGPFQMSVALRHLSKTSWVGAVHLRSPVVTPYAGLVS